MKKSSLVFYEVHCPSCGQFKGTFPYERKRKACPQCGNKQAIVMFNRDFSDPATRLRTTDEARNEAKVRAREVVGPYMKPEQPICRRRKHG